MCIILKQLLYYLKFDNVFVSCTLQQSALEVAGMVAPVQHLKPAVVFQDGLDNIVKMVCLPPVYYIFVNMHKGTISWNIIWQ